MAEQTFRSPGFFEQEIDLSAPQKSPLGVPAGIIGTALKGPAFVPVTIGSFADFETKFGTVDPNRYGPYAVGEYFKYKDAVTYMRVLGAGSNDTDAEISATNDYGIVSKAGFKITSKTSTDNSTVWDKGSVQFITAKHYISASSEGKGFPEFTDNSSFPSLGGGDDLVNLVRGVLFLTTGSRATCAGWDTPISSSVLSSQQQTANITDNTTSRAYNTFKLVLYSDSGTAFGNDDNLSGVRIFTASLDPSNDNYISKVLNTDPLKFQEHEHLLYLDYAVENEIAPVSNTENVIKIVSGSGNTNGIGLADNWRNSFGRYDTRYTTARTPTIISCPFGGSEYDLFHFECLSDGAYPNDKFKVTIANVRASTDPNNKYGTFEVRIRMFDDTDTNQEVLEAFPECTLDPTSDQYVARKIGDKKVRWNFDQSDPDERRLVITGRFPNISRYVRVVMNPLVEKKEVPQEAIPFGFRGIPVYKTSDSMTDTTTALNQDGFTYGHAELSNTRIAKLTTVFSSSALTGSVVPPLPMRFKVTRGAISNESNPAYDGAVGTKERVDSRLSWGVKFERCPTSDDESTPVLNANVGSLPNPIIKAYAKFQGMAKTGNLVSGSGADAFNNNKFTLARVALYNTETNLSTLTGSAKEHMLEAAYLRNADWDYNNYTVNDSARDGRITLATVYHSSSVKFNRFVEFSKFNTMFYGGFDGMNILDREIYYMTDKAASTDPNGLGGDTITGGLGLVGTNDGVLMGKGLQNNVIFSYRAAIEIMTDPMTVNTNILAVPGIRDPFITDLAADRTRDYSMAIYIMDIPHYSEDEDRLFDSDGAKRDVRETSEQFESRRVDNNYCATYFPDVFITDSINNKNVKVPASVVAIEALAYNDTVAYPWFAPAGFNRGSLLDVVNTEVRLASADRDTLYDARINPIANFPQGGFVIFGQKTLQLKKSALDRVNVRRMLLELKRLVVQVADKLLFEPNNSTTRAKFVGQVAPILALIQSQQGIEKFSIVCDGTNNSSADVEQNRMNGRIVVVPTRAIEFIAIDFIITNSGVEFA